MVTSDSPPVLDAVEANTGATAARGSNPDGRPNAQTPQHHPRTPHHQHLQHPHPHQHPHHHRGQEGQRPSSTSMPAPAVTAGAPGSSSVAQHRTTGRPPRPGSAAGGPALSPQAQRLTRPSLGSTDGGGSAGVEAFVCRSGRGMAPGRPPSSSSLSLPQLSSSGSVPAGAALTAVRAAARSASAQRAMGTLRPAESGPLGQPQGSCTAGNASAGSGGAGSPAAGRRRQVASPGRTADGGRSAQARRSGGRGSSGGGGTTAGAAGGGGGGGNADDVSGLPLAEQVAHYARRGAAAAAAGDAMRAAMALHLLNGCFLRATGGYDRATELAATAVGAAPGLVGALVEAVSEGAPQSLVAFNALSYLALAPEVVPRLLSAGLVAVLVGQLRAAGSAPLEQQLLVSGLGLLVTMVRVSGEARSRLAALRGVATALAAALGHGAGAVRRPALQLVQELIVCRKGVDQVRSSAALLAALDRLCEDPGAPGPEQQSPQTQTQQQREEQGEERQGQEGDQQRTQEQVPPQQEQEQGQGQQSRPARQQQQQQQAGSLQRQARAVRKSIAAIASVMK